MFKRRRGATRRHYAEDTSERCHLVHVSGPVTEAEGVYKAVPWRDQALLEEGMLPNALLYR